MADRPVAFFAAGCTVAAWQRGATPAPVDLAPVGAADSVRPSDALFVAVTGLAAEARSREIVFSRLANEAPDRWTMLQAAAGRAEADETRRTQRIDAVYAEVRDFLNAPKVWVAVNAVAGSLLARRRLGADEARDIIERTAGGR